MSDREVGRDRWYMEEPQLSGKGHLAGVAQALGPVRKPAYSNMGRGDMPLPLSWSCPQTSRGPPWAPPARSWRSRKAVDEAPGRQLPGHIAEGRSCREDPNGHVNDTEHIWAEGVTMKPTSEAGTILGASVSH